MRGEERDRERKKEGGKERGERETHTQIYRDRKTERQRAISRYNTVGLEDRGRAMNQGMQAASRSWKCQGSRFFPRASRGM